MKLNVVQKIVWFIGLVFIQVLILNKIHILGYATPFLYIYFILKFDSSVSRNGLLLWAFLLGLCVDIFSNTPGINAAATVFLAFIRPLYLRLFTPRDSQDAMVPSIRSMGSSLYIKYLLACIFTHHTTLFVIMFFSFADIPTLLMKIVGSTLLTFVCTLALDGVRK